VKNVDEMGRNLLDTVKELLAHNHSYTQKTLTATLADPDNSFMFTLYGELITQTNPWVRQRATRYSGLLFIERVENKLELHHFHAFSNTTNIYPGIANSFGLPLYIEVEEFGTQHSGNDFTLDIERTMPEERFNRFKRLISKYRNSLYHKMTYTDDKHPIQRSDLGVLFFEKVLFSEKNTKTTYDIGTITNIVK